MAGKVVKQLAGSGTGQSLSDIMTAMKHTLSGSLIAKILCKATTEEMISPKRKHLAYLVQCTFEPRLSVPDFANYLIGRTQHSNMVVVFKAFITIHHLMQYGHERFSQFIASNNCHFYLPSLSDRNSFQAHGISAFVRPYAKYLDEKASSYREVAFDLCRMKLGKDDGGVRTMSQAKLFKTLPVIEKQLDALLAFDATSNELVNSVLRVAHLHLYRDLIRLYAVYNEAMINLIGRYFSMTKRDCKTALGIYKSFLKRMEAMNAFVKVAESADSSGVVRSHEGDSLAFQPVPPSVLEALEQHLAYLESHKQADSSSLRSTVDKPGSLSFNSPTFSKPNSSNTTPENGSADWSTPDFVLTEKERMHIIEEERARLESFVSNVRKQAQSTTEEELQQSAEQLKKLSADADFVDLLTSTEPDKGNTSWLTRAQSGNDAWSVPVTQQKPTDSSQLALLDLAGSSVSNPFGSTPASNVFPPSDPISSPFEARSSSSNPFLPTSTPHSHGKVSPNLLPAIDAWSAGPTQYTPFGPHSNGINETLPKAAQNPCASSSGDTLDARLAQLAGSLSVRSDSRVPHASYKAADGSLTSVNWPGTSPANTIRNSASLHQLTGPAVAPASGTTNPWLSSFPMANQVNPIASFPGNTPAPTYQWYPSNPAAFQRMPFPNPSTMSTKTSLSSTNPFI